MDDVRGGRGARAGRMLEQYGDDLFRIAFACVKNRADAEDVVQDVFVMVLSRQPEFECEEHERAWLIRCTVNRSRDYLRLAWTRRRCGLTEELEAMDCSEKEREVMEAVLGLEKKYRIPICLHYYYGYSIREIGEILGKKPATVGTWLDRGRKRLRRILGGEADE